MSAAIKQKFSPAYAKSKTVETIDVSASPRHCKTLPLEDNALINNSIKHCLLLLSSRNAC